MHNLRIGLLKKTLSFLSYGFVSFQQVLDWKIGSWIGYSYSTGIFLVPSHCSKHTGTILCGTYAFIQVSYLIQDLYQPLYNI